MRAFEDSSLQLIKAKINIKHQHTRKSLESSSFLSVNILIFSDILSCPESEKYCGENGNCLRENQIFDENNRISGYLQSSIKERKLKKAFMNEVDE